MQITLPTLKAGGKWEGSEKALTHSKSNYMLIEKCKSSGDILISFFKNAGDIQQLSERDFTQVAFRGVYGSPCRNGTRSFSSSSLQGCHYICFSVKLKVRRDDRVSHSIISKLECGAQEEFYFCLSSISMQINRLSEIAL